MTATYSPDDNKLRLYASSRLDPETYSRVKAAGFIWAPKQELFVAPMWTPDREDLLIELCGEIEDEDKSLIDRAEERAERFEDYSENRKADAESAHKAVEAITEHIPLGQPILVGHHSEKHARKDAERITNGMRKAVDMWKQSEYWKDRAAGAIRHAKYKERPDVRARRIKGLEADKRKQERYKAQYERSLKLWNLPNMTPELALKIAGSDPTHFEMLKKEGDKQDWNQLPDAYSALSNSYPNLYAPRTWEEVRDRANQVLPGSIERINRWLAHIENRLAYERAMLAEAGGTVTDQTGPQVDGGCRCWASHRGGWSWIRKVNKVSVTVLDNWGYGGANFTRNIPFDKLSAIMTKAQVDEARAAGLLVEAEDKTGFFLLSEKPIERKPTEQPPEAAKFEALQETLKAGVQVVTANQLFPTPPEIAKLMVEYADLRDGECVLEPSAGTGNIVQAVIDTVDTEVLAYEVSPSLCSALERKFPSYKAQVRCKDFLTVTDFQGCYPRIIMNPPFQNGDDIKHIRHALTFLKPGGRLVAICANGPRQNEQLKPLASMWEELPEDTFKEQGTMVRTALMVIDN